MRFENFAKIVQFELSHWQQSRRAMKMPLVKTVRKNREQTSLLAHRRLTPTRSTILSQNVQGALIAIYRFM
jgi:hypothetical protein